MLFNFKKSCRVKIYILYVLQLIFLGGISFAGEPYQRMVRKFEMPELGIPNPAGLIYSDKADVFFVTPNKGSNELRLITFVPDVKGSITLTIPVPDPINMAFDGKSNSLFLYDAEADELVEIKERGDGHPQTSPDAIIRYKVQPYLVKQSRGLTFDPLTGDIYFLTQPSSHAVPRVVRVSPDPQAGFDGETAEKNGKIVKVLLKSLQGEELRGIAFNPVNDHLYITSSTYQKLYELNREGDILSSRDISSLELGVVQNMVFAPSGDQTDDPERVSLYITDNDMPIPGQGKIYHSTLRNSNLTDAGSGNGDISELSLTQAETLDLTSYTIQVPLVQSVLTSLWSPPSPDPSGLAYDPTSNNLLISDGEVNEMPIYDGVNLWEATLTGSQVREFNTLAFSDEPTGVAYNPNNQHLYFSDDTGVRSLYDVAPGPDGLHMTADDIVSSFPSGNFLSYDPEGVTFCSFNGNIFYADGLNNEIYEISPGANGVFDGGSSLVNSFDTQILGVNDPEGVEFNPDNGTLFIVGKSEGFDFIVETTTTGDPVTVIDISEPDVRKPAGLAYAPTSVNPAEKSLYIVARGVDNNSDPNENDGVLYEFSLGAAMPGVFIDDVVLAEGNTGTVNAQFTVSLSGPSQQTVTVDYFTSNGTAYSGSDYASVSGQVVFQPGETSQPIVVQVFGDETDEPDETFYVNLSNVVNANMGRDQGMATILNDDGPDPVTLSFQDGVNGFTGTRDTKIKSLTPTENYGSDPMLEVDGEPDECSLLYWDLSGIPTTGTVQSAEITVNVTNVSGADYEIYELKRPWVEHEATWYDYAAGQSWQIAGADGTDDHGTTVLGAIVGSVLGSNTFLLNSDGIDVVQSWINDPSSNYGFIFQDYINHNNDVNFSSREAVNTGERPKLTVTYINSGPPPPPVLLIDDVTVSEGNTGTVNAVFTVSLSTVGSQVVTVDYATADGTATTSDNDYIAASGQLTFQPGETSQPVTVVVNGDAIYEPDESFVVNLSNPVNADMSDPQGAATILNDETPPSLAINDVTVTEGNAGTVNAVFAVSLSGANSLVVTVDYTTADGTATTADNDYVAASGQLSFQPGETGHEIFVPVNGDIFNEADETFVVNLSNAVNAGVSDPQGTGTITDDDAPPTLTINDVTVTEGNAGTVNAVFTVSLSTGSGQVVTVNYATADGAATTADNDYVAASGQLTFQPGETGKPVTVVVNGDVIYEPDETFVVNLSNAVNAGISDPQGTGTITNDDAPPSLTINDVTVTEGNTGTVNAVFTVSLTGASSQVVTVDYATADGTATTADNDYVAVSGQLTFQPGETGKPVPVVVNGDLIYEPDETFVINLVNPINTSISDPQGIGTITNDDALPSLSIDDVTVTEGNTGTVNAVFTVSLSPGSGQVVTVDYATADGTATTADNDYVAASGQLTFQPGETGKPVTVVVNGDVTTEPDESFVVNLSNPVNAGISDVQGTGTITDDDAPLSLTINDVTVTEGNTGTVNAVFTVSLSMASGQVVTVDYATADGTATVADNDYIAATGQITFQSGETGHEIIVTVNGDISEEVDETFVVDLSNPVNAGIGDPQGTGTITNDDEEVQLVTVSLQDGVDGYTGTRDTKLINASPDENFGIDNELELDASPPQSSLLVWDLTGIPPGSNVQSVELAVNITNGSSDSFEFYQIFKPWIEEEATWNSYAAGQMWEVEGADGAGDRGSIVLASITGGKGPATISFNPAGVAVFQTWVDDPASNLGLIIMNYVSSTNGLDFSSREEEVISEHPKLTVTYMEGPEMPLLSVDDVTVTEGNSGTINANFTVSLSQASVQVVSVDYETADGTATTADNDYVAVSGQLNFSPGETGKTVSVTVNGDLVDESDETFFINLSNAGNAIINDSQGMCTIADDDGAPSLSVNDVTVTEGHTGTVAAVFTVALTHAHSQVVTVDYATADGTATIADNDYVTATGQITFQPGETGQTVAITVNGDLSDEPDESFYINLSNPVNADISDAQGVCTITDDDGPPSLVINDVTVTEGNTGTVSAGFTVTLSPSSGQVVTVNFATADSSATTENGDYVAASGQLSFQPGETGQPVSVVVNGDLTDEADEVFVVNLSNAVNADISDAQGVCTITDDDGSPSLVIDDVTIVEGNTGTQQAGFTVTLSPSSGQVVTVDYITVDNTATTSDNDYVAASGQVSFQPGETSRAVSVVVNGDVLNEPDEIFMVQLSDAVHAVIEDDQGLATILNDDGVQQVTLTFRDGVDGYTGTRDTKLMSTSPDMNYGSEPELEIDSSPPRSALLFWDLTAIPSGSIIQSVELAVYIINRSPNSFEFYQIFKPWIEAEATWNSYAAGQSWEVPGADGAGDRDSVVLGSLTGPKGPATVSLNTSGVEVVQSWVNDPATNNGMIIMNYVSSKNGLDFSSRERGTLSDRPGLTVTFLDVNQAASSSAMLSGTSIVDSLAVKLPETVELKSAYPNPFNMRTRIKYTLPKAARVRLAVYNIIGRQVCILVDEIQSPGYKMTKWNGRDEFGNAVSSGVYFLKLLVDQQPFVNKVFLQK